MIIGVASFTQKHPPMTHSLQPAQAQNLVVWTVQLGTCFWTCVPSVCVCLTEWRGHVCALRASIINTDPSAEHLSACRRGGGRVLLLMPFSFSSMTSPFSVREPFRCSVCLMTSLQRQCVRALILSKQVSNFLVSWCSEPSQPQRITPGLKSVRKEVIC